MHQAELNAEQECFLCQDPCNSLADLRNHMLIVHEVAKDQLPEYVKLSVQEKLKRKRENQEIETVKLDETADKEPKSDTEALLEETGEFKAFVEAKAKSAVKSMFSDLQDYLDGKTGAMPTAAPADANISVEDVKESFDKLFAAINGMVIPASVEEELREEFEGTKEKTSLQEETKTGTEKFKVPVQKGRAGGLAPVSSDRSSSSQGSQGSQGKLVTSYLCPYAPACSFTLSKKEFNMAGQHLMKEHKVNMKDMTGNNRQTFKFGKIKTEAV